MSWITRADLLRMIMAAIDDPLWHGAINATAPEPVRHADFQRALARTLGRPLFLKAPAWLLRMMMGEMSSIFLFSQRVVPARAQALGFGFDVHFAADALALLLGPPPAALPTVMPLLPSAPNPAKTAPQPTAVKEAAE
jgi:NAD dependent epimerase/dehydratase family enzyme